MGFCIAGQNAFKRSGTEALEHFDRAMLVGCRRTEEADSRLERGFQSGGDTQAGGGLNGLFGHGFIDTQDREIVDGARNRNSLADRRAGHQDGVRAGLISGPDHLNQTMGGLPGQVAGGNGVLNQALIDHVEDFNVRQLAAGESVKGGNQHMAGMDESKCRWQPIHSSGCLWYRYERDCHFA